MANNKKPQMKRAALQAFQRAGFDRREAETMVRQCDGALRQVLREIVPFVQQGQRAVQPAMVYARR